ncbi:hypothetical protein DMH04_17340 [Kibdelosporangium aridum]|uniref:Lipoprotein n=1 Tax=Kibdelosporangium aridum TaxID=2030 RepID=A0A428ZBR1_KIBAR|nr:hypothetical protein [Kibdelosporangium aridum]RSM85514.1 hypothetical protein DMH04_17340 [Kibdelosporangium aridum]
MSEHKRMAALFAALALGLTGCGTTSASTAIEAGEGPPAKVEAIAGKSMKSVKLTDLASKRIGIETVEIAAAPSGTTVPYSAVLYSADGKTWVYALTAELTFVREQVTVANVGGDKGSTAFLSAGPAAGTTVVKTGVIELYGAELGVGK